MVLLSFILTSEMGMNELITRHVGEGWLSGLSDTTRKELKAMYERRVRSNTEIAPVDCLMLHQRLDLVGESDELRLALGFASRNAFKKWKKQLVALRDVLAHGGGLLHAESDPTRAIDLFDEVRGFTERVWDVATHEPLVTEDGPATIATVTKSRRNARP